MASLDWASLVKDNQNNPNAGAGDFSPLPAGDYDLKVKEVTVGQTSTEKTMFKVRAEVQTGAYKGRLLFDNLVVSPDSAGAMSFFFRKMKALGLDDAYFRGNPSEETIAQAMRERPFRGRIKKTTYQGKERNEFESYASAAATGAPAPAQAQTAAAPAPAPTAAPAPAPAPQQAAPAAPPAPAAPAENPWADTQAPPAPPAGPAAPPAPPF